MLEVCLATESHAQDLVSVIATYDHYYFPDHPLLEKSEIEGMIAKLRNNKEYGTTFILAYLNQKPVGFACFVTIHPGGRLRGLVFLKDLYVMPEVRGHGAGHAMMGLLARFTKERDLARIDLTTDPPNTGAQKLYESMGAKKTDKIMYRFAGEDLNRLAQY